MAGCIAGGPFFRDETRRFAQRGEGMSLDIIRPQDVPRGKVKYPKNEDFSLKTQDIDRAKPRYEHLGYLNKPDLCVGSTDPVHAGGRARSYYAPMDRRPRDLSLTTADIEHAQPKVKATKGNRHTDPVCPQYELPSSLQRPATPPRFNGRHTNETNDIERSHPKVLHPERNYVRDPNEVRDIEYASANYQERMLRHPPRPRTDRSLDVRDIMDVKRMPPRETNPMEPVYKVPTNRVTTSLHTCFAEEKDSGIQLPSKDAEQLGEVHGSKPRKLQWDNGEPQLSLVREDIPGTVPQRWIGSVPHNIYDPPEVRGPISFHDPSDIPGAQVGSLKRGIATRRNVNPLNPAYATLDGVARIAGAVVEAERGSAQPSHLPLRAQGNTRSAPSLHATSGGAFGLTTPSASGASSRGATGRSLPREMSGNAPRRSPQEALDGYQQTGRSASSSGLRSPEGGLAA